MTSMDLSRILLSHKTMMRSFLLVVLLCMIIRSSFAFASRQFRSHSIKSFSVLSGVNGENPEESKLPKTGWNHNKPDESSDFWEGPGREEKKSIDQSNRLRTGWLHNTESRESLEKEEKGAKPTTPLARRMLELAMREQERNHRMIIPPTFHSAGGKSYVVTEHMISVPLERPNKSPRIDVFFTIIEKVQSRQDRRWFEGLKDLTPQKRAKAYVEFCGMENADNMILYLQGGPGFGAPTPVTRLGLGKDASWASAAFEHYGRVILMDQRGTGRSTPITKQTLEHRFPELFEGTVQESAVSKVTDYMCNFRADNIVYDAEEIRDALLLPQEADSPRPWGCTLGQSYGGFCQMTYLSLVEHPPQTMLFTGGIAPMLTPTFDVYSSLWERVKHRSLLYYDMYPGDISLVKKILKKLIERPVKLPSGGTLTARRFLQLGLALGSSPSRFASLHALFSSALNEYEDGHVEFNRAFLKAIEIEQSFDDAPIYYWMHETIYGDGPSTPPTDWAAHRALQAKPTEFDYMATTYENSDDIPVLFYGEMVFLWMSEDYGELSGDGLTAVAERLAKKSDWKPLYNAEAMRKAFTEGKTCAAAAVYEGDMFVDYDCCMAVTARGGPLEFVKCYITNEYQHSGLRDDGAAIFKKLHGMAFGGIRTPS